MAWSGSRVLPSCRKKIRLPTPHSGAVRNSLGPAVPCDIPSPSTPMLCTRRSENRLAVWNLSAAVEWLPVCIKRMWQVAQPVLSNSALPLLTDAEQLTPTVQEGTGAARNLMKFEKPIASLATDCGCVSSKLVWSLGEVTDLQTSGSGMPASPRSSGNSSFETPCSTL